jgi:hypothetical protein
MSYFVFDMDETLAHLQSVYYFIASLTLDTKDLQYRTTYFTDRFEETLENAYKLFVKRVVEAEESDQPLGILRPGILQIMDRLYALKKKGKVLSVVIYSNNSHLQSLYFIRDLIHKHVGSKRLINDCIHWLHPKRVADKILYHETRGAISKSWNVLKDIMVHGPIKAPEVIEPMDVHFFDDLEHKNMQATLHHNYHHVPAYNYNASFDRITIIYLNALKDAHVNINQFSIMLMDLYGDPSTVAHITKTSHGNVTLMEDVIDIFRFNTQSSEQAIVLPSKDKGIEIMEEVVYNVEYDIKEGLKGGKRKKNKTHKRRRWTVKYR